MPETTKKAEQLYQEFKDKYAQENPQEPPLRTWPELSKQEHAEWQNFAAMAVEKEVG